MKENEDAPVDLCLEVLRRLERAGVLQELVLVGSWCTHFYNLHFSGKARFSALRTRDIDFLVRRPPKFKVKIARKAVALIVRGIGRLPLALLQAVEPVRVLAAA